MPASLDERTGRLIKVLPNVGGADEVWFNPGDGHYFLADGSGIVQEQVGVVDSVSGREDPAILDREAAGRRPRPLGRRRSGHQSGLRADPRSTRAARSARP